MNANELRIGNWVYDKRNKKNVSVSELSNDFPNEVGYKTENGYWMTGALEYNPIPLTPEILEKCGFGKSDSIHFGAVITGERVTDVKNVAEIYVKRVGIRAQYLHQLQNIYFALTGEELKIEP